MPGRTPRWPAALALVASLLGLVFALVSTLDYTQHLDRRIHSISCSFIPGLAAEQADNACRAAMYSPYSAVLKDRLWGGIPISIFAVGAFGFFAAFALYLLLARDHAPRRAYQFFAAASLTPFLVSLVMLFISATRLGTFCKTCVGIYVSSTLLAIAGIVAFVLDRRAEAELSRAQPAARTIPDAERTIPQPPSPRPVGALFLVPAWLVALGVFALAPAALYLAAHPSYAPYVKGCGKLEKTESEAAVRVAPPGAKQKAVMLVDPLCPSCKALHQRLEAEDVLSELDVTLLLFPLDECNWNVKQAMHPGACLVSRAVICADHRAMSVLDWAYENQDDIKHAALSAAGPANVKAMLRKQFPDLEVCMDAKSTQQRLDKMMRFATDNQLPVSTPQLFLDGTRLCDEDSDIGLEYSIRKLAPSLARR